MPGVAVWHDYFFMVGGGAAALTGLVFVAMTLHLKEIAGQPVHRHRARTILTGFTAVFARCGLVLMGGQSRQAAGRRALCRRFPVSVRFGPGPRRGR